MKQTFTINDLVRFLYREVAPQEALAIAVELSEDYLLNEQFVEMADAKNSMTKVMFEPSVHVLANILSYSKDTMAEIC